ncbi:uncharacterized protein LOC134096045 isoform X2 [Sardina pilchardus]|uniref:uncharacterized protein LOC134096045 isoform X2 n=3 Tax=Sardina pilchardus TaxID=27697 RepID=UPI002E0E5FDC
MDVSVGFLVVLVKVIQGFQIQNLSSGPLTAQLGGSVLLPCSVETPLPLEELEVEWRRTDSDVLVHLFQEGEERPESQDYAYRGRAHFLTVEISQGDYSLLLSNISRGDVGIYSCKVYTANEAHQITIDLKGVEYLVVTGTGAVAAAVGEEVVLNCTVDSHIPPEEMEEVAWKRTDNEMVVLRYQHGEVLVSSDVQYRGRAELFSTEISKGNFSLRMKSVRTEDKGEYICEAHSGSLSANTTVVLHDLGLSFLHYLVLMCCVASFVMSCVAVVHFMTRGRDDNVLPVHSLLVFSPNVLLFSGFILWGSAGGLFSEAAACSVVNLTRIPLLLAITPYVGAGSFQKLIGGVSVTVEHTLIAVVVYSDAFNQRLQWISLGIFDSSHIIKIRVHAYFGSIILFSFCGLCAEIEATYQLPCMLPRTEPVPNSKMEPSKPIWTFILLEISSCSQMLFLALKTGAFSHVFRNSLICIAVISTISIVLIYRLVRKKLQHRGRLCWAATMAALIPARFIITIYFVSHVLDGTEAISPGEGAGLLCAFTLLKMLANLSLSKHPDSTPDIPQTIVYMFGATILSILNSIGLTTKLLLTSVASRSANQKVPDLRLLTFPSECLFVFGCFMLQIRDCWTYETRTQNNSEMHGDLIQDTSVNHGTEAITLTNLHTSDPSEVILVHIQA